MAVFGQWRMACTTMSGLHNNVWLCSSRNTKTRPRLCLCHSRQERNQDAHLDQTLGRHGRRRQRSLLIMQQQLISQQQLIIAHLPSLLLQTGFSGGRFGPRGRKPRKASLVLAFLNQECFTINEHGVAKVRHGQTL